MQALHQGCVVFILARRFGFCWRSRRGAQMALKQGAYLTFGLGAGKAVHRLPLLDQNAGRRVAHAKHHGQLGRLVDIDFGEDEATGIFRIQLFQHWLQHFAGAAVGRPKIHQHGRGHRGFDNVLLVSGEGNVDHDRIPVDKIVGMLHTHAAYNAKPALCGKS